MERRVVDDHSDEKDSHTVTGSVMLIGESYGHRSSASCHPTDMVVVMILVVVVE